MADALLLNPKQSALFNNLLAALTLAVSSSACGSAEKSGDRVADTVTTVSARRATPFTPGIRFDPASLRRGMRVGGLVVDSVDARHVTIDSAGTTRMIPVLAWVGTARFRGTLTLRGRLMKHFDSDVRVLCFEADSASGALMPRWAGDTRRAWFCFSNVEAERLLRGRREGWLEEVVIDQFVIRRSFSDDVNTARLIRIRDLARCYRSPQSVLFGPPTRTGQQGQPPGWIRLEGFPESDHGEAALRDSDGKAIRAGWVREPNDSVTLLASNDFVRIEIRFLVSKENLAGNGTAHSDAALEPDSTGRLSDLRRAWKFSATQAPCDSTQ